MDEQQQSAGSSHRGPYGHAIEIERKHSPPRNRQPERSATPRSQRPERRAAATPGLFPKSCFDPLEVLCDQLLLPHKYALKMMAIGLSYGLVVTMPITQLANLTGMIMTPEHSAFFLHHVQLIAEQRCNTRRSQSL